ncbi:MAG: purine-binding chemotaxis protein CheW [Alphaproteobacteria bacterium]|nr:purine-binding chemotaxis protein CheW [Alphaproteobacteria bacterium]
MSDHFDKTREGNKEDAVRQFLTFTVAGEEYGLDIMTVREIKGWTETTRLPGSSEFMRGVMNLRGLIIPILDLRARFRMGLTEATEQHVVIILAVGSRNVGLLVDAVSDILTTGDTDVQPAPDLEARTDADFITGLISLDSRMVVLLGVDRLFDERQLESALGEAA